MRTTRFTQLDSTQNEAEGEGFAAGLKAGRQEAVGRGALPCFPSPAFL